MVIWQQRGEPGLETLLSLEGHQIEETPDADLEQILSTVQLRLSEPLWPAPKPKCSDKQKVQIIESIFDVQLIMPTLINYSVYPRLTE